MTAIHALSFSVNCLLSTLQNTSTFSICTFAIYICTNIAIHCLTSGSTLALFEKFPKQATYTAVIKLALLDLKNRVQLRLAMLLIMSK